MSLFFLARVLKHVLYFSLHDRSSRTKVFCKKGVFLKILQNSQENTCARVSFLCTLGFLIQCAQIFFVPMQKGRGDSSTWYRCVGTNSQTIKWSFLPSIPLILFFPMFPFYVTATGFEPTTTWFVNEHSTIWPNWPNWPNFPFYLPWKYWSSRKGTSLPQSIKKDSKMFYSNP